MESWDDDDFEPPTIVPPAPVDKWAGEDEEDDVKDNWEDEDIEKEKEKEKEQKIVEPVKKSKKKILSEKIAEKERLKQDDEGRIESEEKELTPEERLRMQQESDLKLALETTFSAGDALGDLPANNDELQEFGENLTKKLLSLSKHTEYINFADNLIRNLCASMPSQDIRKIKNSLDNLYLEKQKIEKGDKSKKNKGKGKVKLKMDDANPLSAYMNDYVDYDDFM